MHDDARGIRRRAAPTTLLGRPDGGAGARRLQRHRLSLHSEIVAPYILHYGTEEQKQRWLPRLASGRDDRRDRHERARRRQRPAGHPQHRAARRRDGSYLLNGSKTFITNGWHADLVIVVAKTDPTAGAKGTSLLLVERGMRASSAGKRLKKLGLKAQDTAELFFDDVRVPAGNLLGGAAREQRLRLPDGAAAVGAHADRRAAVAVMRRRRSTGPCRT